LCAMRIVLLVESCLQTICVERRATQRRGEGKYVKGKMIRRIDESLVVLLQPEEEEDRRPAHLL